MTTKPTLDFGPWALCTDLMADNIRRIPKSKIQNLKSPRRRRRRGIVLLMVVSLLALFVLLGATFTLVALHAVNASKLELKQEQYGDQRDSEFDLVLGQILYDTTARTVLQYHSLLRDLYGYDANLTWNTSGTAQFRESFQGIVTDTTTSNIGNGSSANGQLFTFNFTVQNPLTYLSPIPNYYAGRVITFQGPGAAANHSARIVAYTPVNPAGSPATGELMIEAIESKLAGTVYPIVTDNFVVNGAPFNGAGAGYTTATSGLDAVGTGWTSFSGGPLQTPVSLTPNFARYPPYLATSAPLDIGGLDESWDAPDFQNMFLAMVPPRAAELYAAGNTANYLPIIPSFHRPELVNFWLANAPSDLNPTALPTLHYLDPSAQGQAQNYVPALVQARDFARTFILRPMPWDHPNFTGSNPYFTPQWNTSQQYSPMSNVAQLFNCLKGFDPTGSYNFPTWDVDNDGDGYPDSIWIDPGLPIVTTPEGRRYKRLAAILIKDLDGSLNLNAHGNLMQVPPSVGATVVGGAGDARFRAEYQPGVGWLAAGGLAPGIANNYQTPPTAPTAGATAYANVFGLLPALSSVPPLAPNTFNNLFIPRGLGYGPAEVDFLRVFSPLNPAGPYTLAASDTVAATAYVNLLKARYSSNWNGGNDAVPGPAPSVPTTQNGADYRDALSTIRNSGLPNDFANLAGVPFANWYQQPNWYASPPDVWGRGAIVLDVGGQPLMAFMGLINEVVDSPYEMCLNGEMNGADTPYTVAELEAMLRYHDADSNQIYSRPLVLASPYFANESRGQVLATGVAGSGSNRRRNLFTVTSSDIPTTVTAIPPEMRTTMATNYGKIPGASSILDLYYARISTGIVAASSVPNSIPTATNVTQEMLKVVPWEFFKGQKFDLNRPFGDGIDNDGLAQFLSSGNASFLNSRDEPYEALLGELAWQGGSGTSTLPNLPNSFKSVATQTTNGEIVNPAPTVQTGQPQSSSTILDNMNARQLYARHLFCLALLCLPPNVLNPQLPTSFPPGQSSTDQALNSQVNYQALIIRRIAQWAINCVDYRDSDSIMTPFEFDYNPFNGWQVDGNLATDGITYAERLLLNNGSGQMVVTPWTTNERGVVWGMEAPDLMMTETFAIHDRRVKDTKANKKRTDPMPMANEDNDATTGTLDQFRIPQGSLFVELYCPRPYRWTGENVNQKPQLPLELYSSSGQLLLGKMSNNGLPMNDSAGNTVPPWPVWRIALSKIDSTNSNQVNWHPINALGDPTSNTQASPESASLDPTSPSLIPPTSPFPPYNPGTTATPLVIDRYAYLGNASGLPKTALAKAFYVPTTNILSYPVLTPGQYAVVGPRTVTYLGSQVTPSPSTQLWIGNSPQKIQMSAGGTVTVTNTSGGTTSRTLGTDMQQPVGVLCQIPANTIKPNDDTAPYNTIGLPWTNNNRWPIGLNITEPMPLAAGAQGSTYYTEPNPGLSTWPSSTPGAAYSDFYDDPDLGDSATNFLDKPLDSPSTPGAIGGLGRPLAVNTMTQTGTYQNCSCAFLQRLANPNLPYNDPSDTANYNPNLVDTYQNIIVNPYITVDWQTIDVHVFNGEEARTNSTITAAGGDFDQDDKNAANNPGNLRFRTRQRGMVLVNTGTSAQYQPVSNPFPPTSFYSFGRTPGATTASFFEKLSTTLFTTPSSVYFPLDLSDSQSNTYAYNPSSGDKHTIGYLNSTVDYPFTTGNSSLYYGEAAANPFPWANWNNRPFANAMELLAVPASTPSRFMMEMTPGFPPPARVPPQVPNPPTTTQMVTGQVIVQPPTTSTLPPSPYLEINNTISQVSTSSMYLPFGQLLNFFQTSLTYPAAAPTSYGGAPHLYRLLDYVEVPSPFSGTERWYNPQYFGGLNNGTTPATFTSGNNLPTTSNPLPNALPGIFYRPPFNKLSRFRDPGKVNINTIFDSDVWDSVVGQFPGLRTSDGFANQLFLSRQGQFGSSGVLAPNNTYPTWFANPIRSADSADLMPAVPTAPATSSLVANTSMRKWSPVEATLLRPDPTFQIQFQSTGQHQPLFQVNQGFIQYPNWVGAPPGSTPPVLGQPQYTGQYHDTTRNPYFAYQTYQKIGNVLTTRSNCFAIWITMGYFEVEENMVPAPGNPSTLVMTFDTAHPDGYRLAQEIGYDTGEVTRHRAFFIVDRSIPVGFIPGSRLNTDDCILLRRMIE